jgi:Polyketide cyclase / dehydrase and lipid transport
MKFSTIKKNIVIDATKQKVWHVLVNDTFSRIWYQEFSAGAYAQTDWNINSKVIFADPTGNGLIGKIIDNRKFEALTIEFTGQLVEGVEDYTSQTAQALKGKRESYRIKEQNGPVLLSISADLADVYAEQMEPAWERALLKIKSLSENKSTNPKPDRKMNILFIILIVIAAIIALPLIAALFVRKEYRIEEKVSINKSTPEVFNYVKYVKNQEHYSKWVMADPIMKKTLTGTDGTVGFIYAWKSEDKGVGQGAQEITALTENKKMNTEIRFIKPFEGTSYVTLLTDSTGTNETDVTWIMEGKSKYPMNFMNLFMGKMLHNDMQISLQNLKNNLEKNN